MPRSAPRPEQELVPFTPDPALARDLPDRPGIYRFHGDGDQLLYIGKSLRIRERVQSHLSARHRDRNEYRLAWLARHVSFTETAGELGALLRENEEIKSAAPLFNRKQRPARQLYTWRLRTGSGGYLQPVLSAVPGQQPDWSLPCLGLYRSAGGARKQLQRRVREEGLCPKVLGLEQGQGPCFDYQLRRCPGACCGRESAASHNARLEQALAGARIPAWPHPEPLVVPEPDAEGVRRDYHLLHQWRYLGTAPTAAEARALGDSPDRSRFDPDTFHILLARVDPDSGVLRPR